MHRLGRRTAVPAAALFLGALVVGVGLWAGRSRPTPPDVSAWTPVVAAPQPSAAGAGAGTRTSPMPAPPDAEHLRQLADYVSPDGSYARLGAVEISAIGPVSRPHASL